MTKVLQLKISLDGITPIILRRFLVEDNISFHQLHEVIQRVMGWENYHLYEFKVGDLSILEPSEDYDDDVENSKKVKLNNVLVKEKQKFTYTYDFGDTWEHSIVVEKILKKDSSQKYPVCIAGEMSCPPEDCGGTWGYEEILKIQKNKDHPEYKEKITNWLGEDFDPECFNIDKVNKLLKKMWK